MNSLKIKRLRTERSEWSVAVINLRVSCERTQTQLRGGNLSADIYYFLSRRNISGWKKLFLFHIILNFYNLEQSSIVNNTCCFRKSQLITLISTYIPSTEQRYISISSNIVNSLNCLHPLLHVIQTLQRLILESWYTNLEQTPLNKSKLTRIEQWL